MKYTARRYLARGGGALGIKFTEVEGPTMVGSDVKINFRNYISLKG